MGCANNDAGERQHPTLKNRRKTIGINPLSMINIFLLIGENFVSKSEREFSFAFFRNCAFHECLFIL